MAVQRWSDKRKLITALCVLLVAGFATTAFVNYQVSKAAIRESIVASELPLTSDNLYSEIQKDLVRPIFISSMMASDTFVRDWVLAGERDVPQMTKYLREVKQRYGAFTSFFISERTRIYYQTEGILKKVREDEPRDAWYFRVRAMEPKYEINLDPDLANKDELTIFINYRVFDYHGNYIGVTGVGLTVDAVRKLINEYQQRFKRTIYFVDRDGAIPLFGNSQHPAGTRIKDIAGLGTIADSLLKAGEGRFQYESGGRNHLLNVRYIPELHWYLFVEQIEDEALDGIRRTLYANLLVCLLITAIVLLATSLTINRFQDRLEAMATTDKLTGLANRQAFELLIPQALKEARRARTPLLAILIDIDRFKDVNDRFGHIAGDGVLRAIGGAIRSALRASDIVCRWGGEEFLAVLKNTPAAQGTLIAEKIRRAVETTRFSHDGTAIPVTVSIGVAAGADNDTPEWLIARADKALYEAKAQGRNQVRAAS
jgi:diguanylate cyclase (GGDEF)-like protein